MVFKGTFFSGDGVSKELIQALWRKSLAPATRVYNTMVLSPYYKGNFQGQKGPIYTFVIYQGQYLRNGACCDQCLYEVHIRSHIMIFQLTVDLGLPLNVK